MNDCYAPAIQREKKEKKKDELIKTGKGKTKVSPEQMNCINQDMIVAMKCLYKMNRSVLMVGDIMKPDFFQF